MAMTGLVLPSVIVAVVFLVLNVVPTRSVPESALVTSLPGFNGTFPSKHYSGYVTVDETTGKSLFYYFVASEGKPSEDPVVLWLNGGPGCSSFYGFVYEHGPFNFHKSTKAGQFPTLSLNEYSWSKVSNILYLDSPAGVGFSYSKNESDYITGDTKTAFDTHEFLLKWFNLYPEYLSNPFFISGESYAGIYVPTLADEVVKGIKAGRKPILNFKGYLVGNGVTDQKFDGNALVPFVHGMALISDQLYEDLRRECRGIYYSSPSEACEKKLWDMHEALTGINVYNILEPCYHRPDSSNASTYESRRLPTSFQRLGENTDRPLPVRKQMIGRAWPFQAPVKPGRVPLWPELSVIGGSAPCIDDEVATVWLNNQDVRKALHVAEESLVGTWDLCSDKIQFFHDAGSMIPIHKNLTIEGYRALIFSGDHDMRVPYTGSEAWTRSLGYKVVDKWRPWMSNDHVAGYLQGYDHNLTFLTIKGSGHSVPEYKPRESLDFYSRFLKGSQV